MRFPVLLLWSIVIAVTAAVSAMAQQVTIERDSELRAEARLDAPVVAKVRQGTNGEVTAKNGVWLNVRTPETAGWLFSFNVRFPSAHPGTENGGGNGGSVLGRLVAPRTQINVTATLGARGLDKESLRQASFNAEQMKLLDGYAATKAVAGERASATGLAAVSVDYLDPNAK